MQPKVLLGLIIPLLTIVPLAALEAPRTVSPGLENELIGSPSACPPMSWTLVDKAQAYELAVFRVGDPEGVSSALSGWPDRLDQDLRLGDPVLRQTLPGGANHWLPGSHQCLEPGFFLWAVRAEFSTGWSGWSRPAFFSTPGAAVQPVVAAPSAPPPVEDPAPMVAAEVVLSADGLIESTLGGFRFPDGGEQKKAFTREVFHVQVAADGTKLAGNVVSTSKPPNSTGKYTIDIGRLTIGCSAVGNGAVYNPDGMVFAIPRVIVSPILIPTSTEIVVYLFDFNGNSDETGFQLIVACAPFNLFR